MNCTVRLLAFDLDGTLVDRQEQISEVDRAAVGRAQAAGLEVILVTGRSWRSARPFYELLGLEGPAICYLGALVVADGTGRVISHRPLPNGAWESLRTAALAEGLAVTACVAADLAVADGRLPAENLVAADTAFATAMAPDFQGWQAWNPYTEVSPDLAPIKAPPTMLAIYGDRAVHRVLELFPSGLPHCQFDLSDHIAGERVLHIWHQQVDKGRALARLCAERGIAAEQVAAFGDAPMDRTMLQWAGVGVAMPSGHERLKEQADWVLSPADGIARILAGEP